VIRVEPAKSNVMLAKYQHQASPKTLQPNKFQSTMQFHLRVLFILLIRQEWIEGIGDSIYNNCRLVLTNILHPLLTFGVEITDDWIVIHNGLLLWWSRILACMWFSGISLNRLYTITIHF
jgi:hypothetical protein